MISAIHAVPRNDVILGIVRAADIDVSVHPEGFQLRLDGLLERRRHDLDHDEESRRTAVRDILRNGVYKPTGRGKPASEYLLRAASQPDGSFPTINAPVDVCNYVSLKHILPISLWDVDRSGSSHFVFRLGAPGERYIFNEAGQEIDLEDLLVGCRVREENHSPGADRKSCQRQSRYENHA